MKTCECGCGNPAPISDVNHKRKGYVKGKPRRFIAGHNNRPGVPKSPETRAKMKAAWAGKPRPWLRGPRPGAWQNELPDLGSAHDYIKRHYPKTGTCETCGAERKTDYAFLRHPDPYTRNRDDYVELCRSCHMNYDFATGARKKK